MSKAGRNLIADELKNDWEKRYFNAKRLNASEWYTSERTYEVNNKSNGSRTLYHMVIAEHAKHRRYRMGQGAVKILTSLPDEIKGIEDTIGEIGLIKHMKEKYNLMVDYIRTTNTNEQRREIEIVFAENDDEGCVAGEDILKEEDRLNLKWR